MQAFNRKGALFGVIAGVLVLGAIGLFMHTNKAETSAETTDVSQITPDSRSITFVAWIAEADHRDLPQGIALAKGRSVMMRELIRTDPEQAIREALTLSEWTALPAEIKPYVEEPFSVLANVNVLIACGEDFSETTITTEFPNMGNMETHVYGRRNGVDSKNGTPVQGIRLGNVGALREEIFQPLETADEAASLSLYPVAVADPGGDSVAALAGGQVFYFKTRAALDEANARLAALEELPGPDTGVAALFQSLKKLVTAGSIDFQSLEELAYAAAAEWTGTPRDMYVIMVDFSDSPGQPADPVAFSNSINSVVSQQIWEMAYGKTHIIGTVNPVTYRMPQVSSVYTNNSSLLHSDAVALVGADLSSYETVCVLFPSVDGIWWAGLATVGGSSLWLNDNTNPDVVIHELGHNYGSLHASSWAVAGANPVDPSGTPSEYGDFTDIMGEADAPEGHFNAWIKRHINWFDAENWKAVTTSGTYRVYRSDLVDTTGLLRGLEIDKGDGGDYWLGLRQEFPAYDTYGRGAYLLWKKPADNRSYLLDTTPQSPDGKYDGGLALGQTYSDTVAAVHITPTARGGQTPNEWMDITVNLGSFPGNAAPTASISGPTNLAVQTSALFSVTAADGDGDELAYYWNIGDGLVKPNAPTIAAAWLSGSTATVSCVVSDMKGGAKTVSQNVILSNPLENWTQRTSGTTKNLKDIAVGSGRLVAVGGNAGTTVYSDDGTNWTVHTSGNVWLGNVYFEGIDYDGVQFIAVGMDHDNAGWEQVVYTSPNGTYWTKRYDSNSGSASNVSFNDVAYGGGVYVAVGDGGTIIRSTDGTSWATNASGTTTDLQGVSYGDETFVAVGAHYTGGPAVVLASTDGLSWTNRSAGVDLPSWQGLWHTEYCNDRFLASGWYARILNSTDQGQTFSTLMAGDRQVVSSFAYGDGTYFAAGINKDDADADINLISLDGASWTALATADQDDRNAAVFFNGTFITAGDNGSIWQSDTAGASASGFAVWQLENAEGLGYDRDLFDDADFDGHLNLEEYAMGSSATDAGSLPADQATVSAGTYFQVAYERKAIRPDIDYNVERTTLLASNNWSSANTVMVEDSAANLAVRSAFTISSQTNEFMRLKLELK